MSSDRITVYRPNMRHELGFFETWRVMAANVWRSRELVWQLFKRDFFAQYKKSFLGATWIVIAPVMGIASWVFLQMTGILRPGEVGIPYPAYVLVGTSMWGLFMGLYRAASETLDAGRDLVMQVNYPHEAMLFKQTGQQLANFCITFGLNLIVLIALRVFQPEGFAITFPNWGLLLFPLVALPLFLLASAIGLIVSMINVVAVDISRGIGMLMGLLMYVTPVIYSAEMVANPLAAAVIRWNPLTYLVCSARDILIYGHLYRHDYTGFFVAAAISFAAFMLSWRLFYVSEGPLVERMV